MAYNTVAIKKDVDGKPIPQLYDAVKNEYEVLQGVNGASRSVLYDADGNEVDLDTLLTAIVTALTTTATAQLRAGANLIGKVQLDGSTMEYYGKSTDTKPSTGLTTGSTFFEIDTTEAYMWDGTNWVVM